MARKTEKKTKHYPSVLVFDENLEGVGNVFADANMNIPEVGIAIKGVKNHVIATDLNKQTVFFTSDEDWLTRQPPYNHGGIVFLDTGNLPLLDKVKIIAEFIWAFHRRNKSLDLLENRRFRLTKTTLHEVPLEGAEIKLW
jgi:hypothetical protein